MPRWNNKNCGFQKGHKSYVSDEATRKKISLSTKGKPSHRKGAVLSKETREKIKNSLTGYKQTHQHRQNISKTRLKGSSSPWWKGGITSAVRKVRSSPEMKQWRRAVFERDKYTCQSCRARSGNGKAVYLEAHHIKSFHEHKELRFDINNGLTLCESCHKETDSYAGRIKRKT